MSSHEQRWRRSTTSDAQSTPRPIKRQDVLTSSIEFTPAKDVSARTSSFKQLSGSVTRSVKCDLISSVLSKPPIKQPDFRIFVDIPSQLEANRGPSPATPKRSRAELGDREASFEGLSPIGSPKLCGFSPDFEPQSTPKRRKSSSNVLRSSMSDIFAKRQDDGGSQLVLSKSVDFSKLPSISSIPSSGFTTPKKRSQSEITAPSAPRKPRRTLSLDLPEAGKKLDFGECVQPESENTPVSHLNITRDVPVDYAGAMGVVGFISSYLARGGARTVPLAQLVQLVSSASVSHKTATSALLAVRNLAKAIPEWVAVSSQGDVFTFSGTLRTFEVLQKLAERRRKQIMEETNDLRSSIADMRKSISQLTGLS